MTRQKQKSQSQGQRRNQLHQQVEDIAKQVNDDQRPGRDLDVPLPEPIPDQDVLENAGIAPHERAEGLPGNEEPSSPRHPDIKAEKNASRAAGDPDRGRNDQIINPKSNAHNQYH